MTLLLATFVLLLIIRVKMKLILTVCNREIPLNKRGFSCFILIIIFVSFYPKTELNVNIGKYIAIKITATKAPKNMIIKGSSTVLSILDLY